ncbi:hypothetical protein BBD40_23945 [Paenibacillus ihbetae]|uniref:Apea-like HEPN domain-containing protein n=1 Tax=Paenibacillus ihbetae TaxID=1870820 RepID=A0ABX3JTG8_9BACL|nr:hypothetical protein BBD40_23945 [Paenibacillus ihbetae]
MKERLIYITENVTFRDIKQNNITKSEVYKRQINNWYIKPARILMDHSKLMDNYELEIALLTLLITFFEAHGQYLLGVSSERDSKRVFKYGFRSFLEYLSSLKGHKKDYYDRLDLDQFYKQVRCGLVHNGYITTNGTSYFIDRYKTDTLHVIYPNIWIRDSVLINTFNMLEEINSYINYYLDQVLLDNHKKENFEKMFDLFFNIDTN